MTSYSMDIEMFISEVKKYPEIWNNNSEDSRSPMRRFQAWTEIARLFIDDFDDLSELEKNDVCEYRHDPWTYRSSLVQFLEYRALGLCQRFSFPLVKLYVKIRMVIMVPSKVIQNRLLIALIWYKFVKG